MGFYAVAVVLQQDNTKCRSEQNNTTQRKQIITQKYVNNEGHNTANEYNVKKEK
jgi:hypothetical protein